MITFKPVEGKKVFLYYATPADGGAMADMFKDMDKSERLGFYDWDLAVEDIEGYLNKVVMGSPSKLLWVAKTKEGKATRTVGFIWFNLILPHWVNLEGMLNVQFVNGIDKEFKKGKYTYLEDALITAVKYVFENTPVVRVGYVDTNPNAMTELVGRVGFGLEGRMRGIIKWNGEFRDGYQYSILKGDKYAT